MCLTEDTCLTQVLVMSNLNGKVINWKEELNHQVQEGRAQGSLRNSETLEPATQMASGPSLSLISASDPFLASHPNDLITQEKRIFLKLGCEKFHRRMNSDHMSSPWTNHYGQVYLSCGD